MEKLGKYMTVEEATCTEEKTFAIRNARSGATLGAVELYKPWRRWVFTGSPDAVFSADCLREIAGFLERAGTAKP